MSTFICTLPRLSPASRCSVADLLYSVNSHVNYVLTLYSQKIFLLKRLRDQGLNCRQLDTVFQAIVVSRILYALPGWGPFLNKELTERINAFFKRAYQYGFTTKIMEVTSLLDNASKDLFCNMQKAHHCLFGILLVEDEHEHEIRKRGHNFV